MSRAGLLAGCRGLAALALSVRRAGDRSRLAIAAATAALGLGVVVNLSGWASRAPAGHRAASTPSRVVEVRSCTRPGRCSSGDGRRARAVRPGSGRAAPAGDAQ